MLKASLLTVLALFSTLALVPAQVGRTKLPTEALEKPGDAPAFIYRTESSPGMISQLGAFTSYQVNVDANGQNIVGDAANEPSITLDPTNPNRMAIGWRQFDSVFSNFRKGGWGYTTNGGTTWTFPGSLDTAFRSDPVLFSTETGTFYYLSLIAGFSDEMWRSLNAGQSWAKLAFALGGDKQWFTIDNTSSSGHGFQYQSWSEGGNNYQGRQFTRSTDGGFTWMDPIDIPNDPSWGTLDVDTNGNLFIGGMGWNDAQFWCVRSSDAKNGAFVVTFDQATQVNLGGQISGSEPINPGGLMGQAFLAVDRSGTSTNNNVYMLASVLASPFYLSSEVMFAKSTDGGKTFGAPKRINDDPVNSDKWHWFGTFSVAPNGRLDAVWYDSRNAANNTDSQLFYSYSHDGGDTWSANEAVSNAFDPFLGYPNQNKIGDYITIVSDNGGGNVAYCATFNGEQDIYYVRVAPPVATPSPTPTPTPTPSPVPTPTPSPTSTPTPTPPNPTPTPSPSPTPTPTSTPTPSPTATPSPTPAAQALNLSTRMRVQTGDNIGIGGFIITGSAPKRVLVKVLGPSLARFQLSNLLDDPVLELHGQGTFATRKNDDWKEDPAQEAQIQATGLAPTHDDESAIDITLAPGSYTALASGKDNTSGLGVIEVYDLAQPVPSKLANISTRALVGTGDNIVIAGFTLGGNSGADRVAVRGMGPSLTASGVPNPLENPVLELRDGNGVLLLANDDWEDDSDQAAELSAAKLALPDELEAAVVKTLSPGAYTAFLKGLNDGVGIGLVEVYDLGP